MLGSTRRLFRQEADEQRRETREWMTTYTSSSAENVSYAPAAAANTVRRVRKLRVLRGESDLAGISSFLSPGLLSRAALLRTVHLCHF